MLLLLAATASIAGSQTAHVRILNLTRPGGRDFQVGDRFEVLINAAPDREVSVRTTMQGRTDWSSVIGSTDSIGRWSAKGRFEKGDFGDWREVWTVGNRLAVPEINFSVGAPCTAGGAAVIQVFGPNRRIRCETPDGHQVFTTPSLADSFRTPDGRVIPGREQKDMTQDEYQMDLLQHFISRRQEDNSPMPAFQSSRGGRGGETAQLIARLIGVNAIKDDETRNLLRIIRSAFAKPETIAPSARAPSRTLPFLQRLEDVADQPALKQEIAETIAYVASR